MADTKQSQSGAELILSAEQLLQDELSSNQDFQAVSQKRPCSQTGESEDCLISTVVLCLFVYIVTMSSIFLYYIVTAPELQQLIFRSISILFPIPTAFLVFLVVRFAISSEDLPPYSIDYALGDLDI